MKRKLRKVKTYEHSKYSSECLYVFIFLNFLFIKKLYKLQDLRGCQVATFLQTYSTGKDTQNHLYTRNEAKNAKLYTAINQQ